MEVILQLPSIERIMEIVGCAVTCMRAFEIFLDSILTFRTRLTRLQEEHHDQIAELTGRSKGELLIRKETTREK